MTTQLDEAREGCVTEYTLLTDSLLECGKTGKPYLFEGKDLNIRLASETEVQPGDKVLMVVDNFDFFDDKPGFGEHVRVFTVVRNVKVSKLGWLPTEDHWWNPEFCFKVLNPEVLEQ